MQSVENPNQGEQETHEGHFFKIIEKTKKAKEEKGSKESDKCFQKDDFLYKNPVGVIWIFGFLRIGSVIVWALLNKPRTTPLAS